MSGGKKKRRRPDYRPPERGQTAATEGEERDTGTKRPGGLLGFLAAGDPSQSPYPTLRASYGRAFLAVCSSPVLLASIVGVVLAARLTLDALGLPPQGTSLTAFLALPPVSSIQDVQASVEIYDVRVGLLVVPAFVLVRSIIVALLAGMVVQSLIEGGRVTMRGVRSGLGGFPVILGSGVIGLGAVFLGSVVVGFIPQLAIPGLIAVLAAVIFFLGSVPVIAVRSRSGLQWTIRKSVRAARIPGSQNVVVAVIHVILALFVAPAVVPGAGDVDAAPGFATWVGVLLANVIHVVYLAVYCYRYLYAEDAIPDPPEPRRIGRR